MRIHVVAGYRVYLVRRKDLPHSCRWRQNELIYRIKYKFCCFYNQNVDTPKGYDEDGPNLHHCWPNGAGKTTFANAFIPATPTIQQFVNADLIAYGLSPFAPEKEAVLAGKLMLKQIDKLVRAGETFGDLNRPPSANLISIPDIRKKVNLGIISMTGMG